MRIFTYQGHVYGVVVPPCVKFYYHGSNTLPESRERFERELGVKVIGEDEANEMIFPWTGKRTYGCPGVKKPPDAPEPCYMAGPSGNYRLYVAEEIQTYIQTFAQNFPSMNCESCYTTKALPGIYVINEAYLGRYWALIDEWKDGNYKDHRYYEPRRFFVCSGCRDRIIGEEEQALDGIRDESARDRARDNFYRLQREVRIINDVKQKEDLLCRELAERERSAVALGREQVRVLRKYLRSDPEAQKSLARELKQLRTSRI
jgi:hypothetical protein